MKSRRGARALVGTLAAAAALMALAASPFGARLESGWNRSEVPGGPGWNRLQSLLVAAGALAARPPAAPAAGECAEPALVAGPVPAEATPSHRLAVAEAGRRGGPLLSLYLDPCRRARIDGHPLERGRDWEERGWVSLFEGGAHRFTSAVGVRVHGGANRRHWPKSYRLHFRRRYGASGWPGAELGSGLDAPVDPLILDSDVTIDRRGVTWYYLGAIAADVARRLGAEVPAMRPVPVSVNGEPPRPYVLSERIDAAMLERRFGHRDFEVLRAKWDVGQIEPTAIGALRRELRAAPAPFDERWAAERYDLERLTDALVAMLVCATGEPFQAAVVRDRTGALAGGRYSFLVWDVDMSFVDPAGNSRFGRARGLLPFLLRGSRDADYISAVLLERLLVESPDFRWRLAARATEALNHELRPEFLSALVDRYERAGREAGVAAPAEFAALREFFRVRPRQVLAEIEHYLDAGTPQTVEVDAPAGAVRVDGHAVAPSYRGHYPRGLPVVVEIAAGAPARFLGWRVDGVDRKETGPRLELEVDRPLRIEARFAEGEELPAPADDSVGG